MVCGSGDITLAAVSSGCEYSGYTATDSTITLFWSVLGRFDSKFVSDG